MSSSAITIVSLPPKFKEILEKDEKFSLQVKNVIEPYSDILKLNGMEFFPEYTDHSINHIEEVLQTAEMLIPDNIFEKLTPEDIGVMVISVVLHDIGMHTSADMFKNMIGGAYNIGQIKDFDKDIWSKLWDGYKKDCLYWDSEKKENVFGNKDYEIKVPDLEDLQELNDYQKKFIGEFIRIYHCRIAHEISKLGYIGSKHIKNNCNESFKRYLDLAGLVARSHGINIRNKNIETYLKDKYKIQWKKPLKVHIVYLMALIRIADYLQIDKQRTNETGNNARTMYSPYSRQEHAVHQAISELDFLGEEEKIIVPADPENARTHVKIEKLVNDIQWEFDQTWAYLGEIYGNEFTLKYRRIEPNFIDEGGKDFVPQQFSYRFNDSLAKKLVGPLYDNNPTYGVRELVQNAVDACRECKEWDEKDPPHVVVKLDTKENLFTITDTGKGMTLEEIQKYFLTIGSSFNDNVDWKKWRDDNNVYRSGRFGIGVLASFLLGDKICVETRSKDAETGYSFKAELGDKFIEIQKNDELKRGTTIKIKCTPKNVKRLDDQANKKGFSLNTEWYNWYVENEPSVSYFLNNVQLIPELEIDGLKKLKHSSESFGDVFWKSKLLFRDNNTNNQSALYCNGFLINKSSFKRNFSSKLTYYYPFKLPDLQIVDKYNKLPINLNRTNIESAFDYDFELDLAKETCKDMICQLISFDIPKWFDLKNNMVLGYNGFNVKNTYTYKQKNAKNSIQIFINKDFIEMDGLKKIFNKYSESYFTFSTLLENKFTIDLYIKIKIKNSNVFIYSKSLESSLIKNEINLTNIYQRREYKECVILYKELSDNSYFDKIIDFLSNILSSAFYIFIEKTIKYKPSIYIPELEEIFQKYLGDDPLIPYDLEERKKKFPLIFQDFPDEIEYYRKKYQEDKEN